MQQIIERISVIENGFKPIEFEAIKIFDSHSRQDSMTIACDLLQDQRYQVRSMGVFLLGFIASSDLNALEILRTEVSCDSSWQVQEILAKSFDRYCNDIGYEKSLPTIKDWLNDSTPTVCRAVTEGLRIWTNRDYFKENPQVAIQLISRHKAGESEYLRKSVGNALRDISKKHRELIENELSTWDLSNQHIRFTYRYATRSRKLSD